MIIDSHIHFGKALGWDLPEQELIRYICEYKIDYGIVSNVSGIEFDHHMNKIDMARQYPQIQLNKRTAELVKEYPSKLKGLCWVKPYTEGCTLEFEDFIEANKQYFCGIKVHTYYSALQINNERITPYILLCRKYKWPCIVPVGKDNHSLPEYICETARNYPDINFIMVHVGSGENQLRTLEIMGELPNLYGDTTWIGAESVVKTIRLYGSHRILFGTDAIVYGVHTADKYTDMIDYLKTYLTGKELEDVFYSNAVKLFNLELETKTKHSFF